MSKRKFELDKTIEYPIKFRNGELSYLSALICNLEIPFIFDEYNTYETLLFESTDSDMRYYIEITIRFLHSRVVLVDDIETQQIIGIIAYFLKQVDIDSIEDKEDLIEIFEDTLTWYVLMKESKYFSKETAFQKFTYFRNEIENGKNLNEVVINE